MLKESLEESLKESKIEDLGGTTGHASPSSQTAFISHKIDTFAVIAGNQSNFTTDESIFVFYSSYAYTWYLGKKSAMHYAMTQALYFFVPLMPNYSQP